MNYQDYMNKMQALAAKYDLTIDELQELLEMGYSEEDLAKMSVEKEDDDSEEEEDDDSKEYTRGGYVLPKHQTNAPVVKNFDLSAQGYGAQNQFENSVGTYSTNPLNYGQPVGMGKGNNYAQTADKAKIEKFISDQFGSTWDQMPDNLQTQIRDMAFNYGVDTPDKQKNILAGLAQAIGHNTPGSNVPDGLNYRQNLSLQDAKNIISGVQDWSDENLYNNYINVRGNQMTGIAQNPANNIPSAYQETMSTRPQAINNMYYGGTSGYGFPNSNQNTSSNANSNDGKLSFGKIGTGQNMGVINDAISKAGTKLLENNKGLATGLGVANRILKGGINTLSSLSKYDAAAQTQRQNAQAQQQAMFNTDNGVERRKFDFQGQNDPLFALSAELGAKAVKTEDNMVNKNYSNNGVPIEAEGGEFYLTPSDGATVPIKGPSHDEGGVKFVAEEGSYIISDHIKISGSILNSIIGKPVMKENQNITFAEAIRKFPKYFDTKNDVEQLNNKKLDPIAANTFRVNLKNKLENLSKLIAHQQEQNNNNGEEQEGQQPPQAQSGMLVPNANMPEYTLRGVNITTTPFTQMAPGPTGMPLNMNQFYSPMFNRGLDRGLDNYAEQPTQSQAELAIYSRIERANRDEDLRRLGISSNENSLKQYENLKNNGYSHPQALQMVMDAKRGSFYPTPNEADEFAKMGVLDKGLLLMNAAGPFAAAKAAGAIPVPKPIQRGSIFQGATSVKPVIAKGKLKGFDLVNNQGTKTRYTPSEIQWHLGESYMPNINFASKRGQQFLKSPNFANQLSKALYEANYGKLPESPSAPYAFSPPNKPIGIKGKQTPYGPMSSQAEEIYQEQLPTGDLPSSYDTPPRFEYLIKDSKTGQLRSLTPQEKIDMNKGLGTLRYINPARMNNPIGNTYRRGIDPSESTDLVPSNYEFGPEPKPGFYASTVQRINKGVDPRERETVGGLIRTLTNYIGAASTLAGLGAYYIDQKNKTNQTDVINPKVNQVLNSFTPRQQELIPELDLLISNFMGDTTKVEKYLSTRTDSTSNELRALLDKVKNIQGDKTIIYEREDGGKNESDNTQDTEQPSSVINNLILHPEAYADQLAALMEAKQAAQEQARPKYSPQTYPEFIQNYILPIMSVGNIPSVDEVSTYSMYDPTQQQMLPSEYMGGGYVLPKHQTQAAVGNQPPTYKTSYSDIENYFKNNPQGQAIMKEAIRRHRQQYPNSPATPEQILGTFLQAQKYNINARDWANDPNISQEERTRRQNEMKSESWDDNPKNKEYRSHNFGEGQYLDDNETKRFQSMYMRMAEMQKEGFPGMENFDLTPIGVYDESRYLGRPISKADSRYGNTTVGEITRFKENPNPPQKICGCMGDEPVSREHTEEESKMPGFRGLPCGTPCKDKEIVPKFSCECVNNKPIGKADPNGTYNSAEEAAKAPGCCKEDKPKDQCACEKDPSTKEFIKNAVVTKYSLDDPKWKNGSLAIQDCALLGQPCSKGGQYRESLPMAMNLLTLPEPRTLNYREQYNFPRYDPQLVSYRSAKNDAASLQAQARAAGMPGQFSKLVDAYGKITEQENNTNAQIINQARQINTDIGVREQLAQQPANTRFIDANNADLAAIYADQYAKQKDLVSSQMGVNAYNTGLDFYQNMVGGFRVGANGQIYNINKPTTFGQGASNFMGMSQSTQVPGNQSTNTAAPGAPASGTKQQKVGGKNTKKKKQFTKRKYF